MWKRVDEVLPEVSHDELALWNGKFSRVGFYLSSLKHGNTFFSPMDEKLHGITHWMPLNTPPISKAKS